MFIKTRVFHELASPPLSLALCIREGTDSVPLYSLGPTNLHEVQMPLNLKECPSMY